MRILLKNKHTFSIELCFVSHFVSLFIRSLTTANHWTAIWSRDCYRT